MTGRLKCNRKGWEQLKKRLMRFDERHVQVGFLGNERYPDQDLTVKEVAWMNDQGTSQVPARPFMTVDFHDFISENFHKDVKELFVTLLFKKNVPFVKELEKLADKYADSLKEIIYDYPGHNSDWWVDVKGFDDPLFHTGVMVNAVSSRVIKKRTR